jgi:5-methylcytosine-specific restriction endonuclease McrA
MLLNAEEGRAPRVGGRRELIPREVRRAVFERDGGKCAQCGSNFDLQYDHVIPVALGGATTIGNLQLLCADCNREKGADV